ncbi:S26 family signal peptidase [Blastomonas aquatica]|uniref:S26 family signal peptidase n=1 Tax=Blastomonas aquatica TaxID=1510276 RepID=UPI00166BFA26|nr:S26 family signal peptidase [Blastomonas aquatica]
MSRSRIRSTIVWAGLFSTAFAAIAVLEPHPRVLWNASASAPIGLYSVDGSVAPEFGEYVVIQAPQHIARFVAERRYLPEGVPLLKQVAALPGQIVCRTGAIVTVDAAPSATARSRDRVGRAMPVWQGCRRISADELFLLNPAADSLDGRYFGPVPASSVIGIARPVLVRRAPGAPLRWNRDPKLLLSTTTGEEHQP